MVDIYKETEKKVTFCKLKRSLSRNFVSNFQTFRGILSSAFYVFVANSAENNFLPISENREAKVHPFLGICLYECFIYRSNFVFRKCLETRRHLGSGRKTVNSQDIPTYGSQSTRAKIAIH